MSFHRAFHGLAMAMLAATALSACSRDDRPEWVNSMMGMSARPHANAAVGHKRVPALNPRIGDRLPPGSPGAPPSLETNPYEYFESLENPAAHAPVAGNAAARKSFPVNLPYADPYSEDLRTQAPPSPGPQSGKAPPAAYPDLSSVPYVSPEMREIRAQRDGQMRTMEEERRQADEKKRVLEQAIAPEGAPQASMESSPSSPYADRQRELQGTAVTTPAQY